jgi:hypothetical protein
MTRVVEEEPKCSGSMREGENKTLTLKIGFVYHDRNNTCIHMRTEDSNIIYMYKRGRIYQEDQQQRVPQGAPCHVRRFLGHHIPAHHQNLAPRDCSRGPNTEGSTAPQVGGNSDWVQCHRLSQEHGGHWAAPAACLPNHRQC